MLRNIPQERTSHQGLRCGGRLKSRILTSTLTFH